MTAHSALPDDLSALSIRDYLRLLGSDYPAPGGGSAGALCSAVGVSLIQMACGINAKRAKNPHPEKSRAAAARAEKIREELLPLLTEDAKIYEKLSAVWKEKGPSLEAVVKEACEIPLKIARLSIESLALAEAEIARTSLTLLSDLEQAAWILYRIFHSTTHHINGNLSLMTTDSAKNKFQRELTELSLRASSLIESFEKKVS